jgi:hypothetical protein
MDRFTRGFVLASLVYFLLGSLLGVHVGGGGSAALPFDARFAHVHFMLLGFMSMMIYGVGYFVLPRFNGKALRWEGLVPVHFLVANAGLLGMVFAPRPSALFHATAGLNVLSAVLFAANLVATILLPEVERAESGAEAEPGRPGPEALHADMRVGEVISTWPESVEVLVANGFPSLADPEHRAQVKNFPITLRMAAQRHNVDVDTLLARLAFAIGAASAKGAPPAAATSSLRAGDPIGPDHVLGHILATYPATEKVFRKYYGSGCFSCPGQATETVRQSALLHNVDMKGLLAELNGMRGR